MEFAGDFSSQGAAVCKLFLFFLYVGCDFFIFRYFRHWGPDTTVRDEEVLMNEDKAPFLQIGNGWVMNADPLKNFAELPSKVSVCLFCFLILFLFLFVFF